MTHVHNYPSGVLKAWCVDVAGASTAPAARRHGGESGPAVQGVHHALQLVQCILTVKYY